MTNLSPHNQMMCLQCEQPFDPARGTPIGKYTVCSPRCADAILNRVQRDYPTMRQDEAIAQMRAESLAKQTKKNSG